MPSRKQLDVALKDIFQNAGELGVDRRTLFGKSFAEIFQSNEVNFVSQFGTSFNNERMGAGAYLPEDYDTEDGMKVYDKAQTADDQDIADSSTQGQVGFVQKDVPTSSTNYSRPRTVAAGYTPDPDYPKSDNGTMTVVFRDGTFYNYYKVTHGEWQSFHASYSKGKPWLNRGKPGWKQTSDGLFVGKPRGNADMSQVLPEVREALYRVARATQLKKPPKPGRTHSSATLADGSTMSVRNNLRSPSKAHKAHAAPKAPTGKRKAG
jgi:hypothetical protein